MCGIFGLTVNRESAWSPSFFQSAAKELFKLSESRGKEASGLALAWGDEIDIVKRSVTARQMIREGTFQKLFEGKWSEVVSLIGHSRMETNGSRTIPANNQPIVKKGIVTVHNGIIVNHSALWREFPDLERETELDTEILPVLIHDSFQKEGSWVQAVRRAYQRIEGVATIAALFDRWNYLLLASNNGSLYLAYSKVPKALLFASEKPMLKTLLRKVPRLSSFQILHVQAGTFYLVDTEHLTLHSFDLCGGNSDFPQRGPRDRVRNLKDVSPVCEEKVLSTSFLTLEGKHRASLLEDHSRWIHELRRCSRCVLPASFPFIRFDPNGVCNVCHEFRPVEHQGRKALADLVEPFRKPGSEPDSIVALSGGRDSTFALHYLKTQLGMNPVAYTYDWGMITDLARRNISRVCSRLGVEHVLISADIPKKRTFIRKNVEAWLRQPRLGTIPLFMAGDKQFFYYAETLRKRMGLELIFFGMNPLERTDFKVAFCGIREKKKPQRHYHLAWQHKVRLAFYYGKEFLRNPGYLNRSILDTLFAFASYYLIRQQFFLFYDYIEWNESEIVRTLREAYNWETASDTSSTWRIGDGTASFYNYIYVTVAGFSESDTFRSNQIRQGLISREEALQKIQEENRPRYESLAWYCDTNGLDFEKTIKTINQIPKLYPTS